MDCGSVNARILAKPSTPGNGEELCALSGLL
jgi:hypothetical protein